MNDSKAMTCLCVWQTWTASPCAASLTSSVSRRALEKYGSSRLFHARAACPLTDAGRPASPPAPAPGVLRKLEETELALSLETTEPRGRVQVDTRVIRCLHAPAVVLKLSRGHALLMPHVSFSDRSGPGRTYSTDI
jgi:hypothetical protein